MYRFLWSKQKHFYPKKQNMGALFHMSHKLETPWSFWISNRSKLTAKETDPEVDYHSTLKRIGTFSTIEEFWSYAIFVSFKLPGIIMHSFLIPLFYQDSKSTLQQPTNFLKIQSCIASVIKLLLHGKSTRMVEASPFSSAKHHSVLPSGKVYC